MLRRHATHLYLRAATASSFAPSPSTASMTNRRSHVHPQRRPRRFKRQPRCLASASMLRRPLRLIHVLAERRTMSTPEVARCFHHLAEHLFIPIGRHTPARAPSFRTAAAALPCYTSLMDRNIFPVSTVVIFCDRPSSRVTLCAGKKPTPCGILREPWPSSVQQPPPLRQSISFPLL